MLVVSALAACSKASSGGSSSSTTPPPTSNSVTGSTTASSASLGSTVGHSSVSVTPTPTVTVPAAFNGTCDDLLPVSLVNVALGRPVVGTTKFVVGVADRNIGRLTYLNCRYGFAKAVAGKPAPTPTVEITVSLYDTAARASKRVSSTVDAYLANGAVQTRGTAGRVPVTVLAGYNDPTVVAAAGNEAVAITVVQRLFVKDRTTSLTSLAKAVLEATVPAQQSAAVADTGTAAPAPSGSPAAS